MKNLCTGPVTCSSSGELYENETAKDMITQAPIDTLLASYIGLHVMFFDDVKRTAMHLYIPVLFYSTLYLPINNNSQKSLSSHHSPYQHNS